jgi:hypothetical protein
MSIRHLSKNMEIILGLLGLGINLQWGGGQVKFGILETGQSIWWPRFYPISDQNELGDQMRLLQRQILVPKQNDGQSW